MNKKEKLRWIRARNDLRKYPECNLGKFFSWHDPLYDWNWVDFRVFHTKRKHYFAVAAATLEYSEYEKVENEVLSDVDLTVIGTPEWRVKYEADVQSRLHPIKTRPTITTIRYSPIVTGVMATLNTPIIKPESVNDFVDFFRSLGEPIRGGFRWDGEEVEINFENFKKTT